MPIVQISLIAGRDEASIKRCLKAVARAVQETLGAPLVTIRVIANSLLKKACVPLSCCWHSAERESDARCRCDAGVVVRDEDPE